MKKAIELMNQGRKDLALSSLKQFVRNNPGNVEAGLLYARWLTGVGQAQGAISVLLEQVVRHPGNGHVHFMLAELYRSVSVFEAADKYYRQALVSLPGDPVVAHNYALSLQLEGRLEDAISTYQEALRRNPLFIASEHNLASIKLARGELDEAEAGFLRVLKVDSAHLNAAFNLGLIAERRGQLDLAESAYVGVLRRDGSFPQALLGLASLLFRRRRNLEWAEKCYKAFIRQQPESSRAYNELGMLLSVGGRLDEAAPCFEAAVDYAADVESAVAPRENLLNTLLGLGRFREADECLSQLMSSRRDDLDLALESVRLKLMSCEWSRLTEAVSHLEKLSDARSRLARSLPVFALATPGLSERAILAIGRARCRQVIDEMKTAGSDGKRPRKRSSRDKAGKPVRVGYMYTDVAGHQPSIFLDAIVGAHASEAVEIYIYTFNQRNTHVPTQRLVAQGRHICELWDVPRIEAVERVRDDKLDILVDLNGWTSLPNMQVLAGRPAPLTATLGYPASLGDKRLADFLVADETSLPMEVERDYAERVIRVPSLLTGPEGGQELGPRATRADLGLPTNGVVFCAFIPTHQINPEVFDAWCRLLVALPDSALWLMDVGNEARDNLLVEAVRRGVDPAGIVFAAPDTDVSSANVLALADIALDSWPMSAGRFALDALTAGIPIIAHATASYRGRLAASLLLQLGRSDLVADSERGYYATAYDLAMNVERRECLRQELRTDFVEIASGASRRTAQTLESAYAKMVSSPG